MASVKNSAALEWKFSQAFGDRIPGEEIEYDDLISAIEFEKRGKYLAVGDNAGRVVLFVQMDGKDPRLRKELENSDYAVNWYPKYRFMTEFQSHYPEVDYMMNVEIEEKINKIRWCATPNDAALFILSANNRTIKLWKILDRRAKKVTEMDPNPFVCSENALLSETSFMSEGNEASVPNGYRLEWTNRAPKKDDPFQLDDLAMVSRIEEAASARCRKVYAHAHDYNINSISTNSDGETYLSADDLRINLWNLEISDQCFNIIDMKPSIIENLTEVITSAEFHPVYCNLLAYSSTRGFIRLVDMRQSALCDQHARILRDCDNHGSRSFFTEIIASISDIKFVRDGRYIISRDYMNLKLWDLHMDTSPVATFKIHEHLRPKLSNLYDNDAIFDKFECCVSGDGLHFASGSYSDLCRVFSYGAGNKEPTTFEASKTPYRVQLPQTQPRVARLLSSFSRRQSQAGSDNLKGDDNCFPWDLNSKLLHMAWHPRNPNLGVEGFAGDYRMLEQWRGVEDRNHLRKREREREHLTECLLCM